LYRVLDGLLGGVKGVSNFSFLRFDEVDGFVIEISPLLLGV